MQLVKKEPLIEFLNELRRLIEIAGPDKALDIIKSYNEKKLCLSLPDERMQFIVNMILTEFDYTPEAFLYGKHLRGDYKYAVGFCVYFLYPDFSIGEIKKHIFQQKDKSALSRNKDLISKLNPKYKNDQPYILLKAKFENKLNEFDILHHTHRK